MQKLLAYLIVKISYYITYLLPVNKNKVSIISYFNEEPSYEFTLLIEELEMNNYQVALDLHLLKTNLLGKLAYLFHFIKQVYLFNTSSIVLLDGNNFVYANIKTKHNVKTIQLWHASGAIKKFGQNIKRIYDIKPYDYVISPAPCFNESFASSLNTPLDKVIPLGNSKSDYLFKEDIISNTKQDLIKKYNLENKTIILYAPTFRGEGFNDMQLDKQGIEDIKSTIKDNEVLLVKLHPLMIKQEQLSNDVINVNEEHIISLLMLADIVISDYSALVFDSLVLRKATILYLYDLATYQNQRGLSFDLELLNIDIAYNKEELSSCINKAHKYDNKLLELMDGHSSYRIVEFINQLRTTEK